MPIAKGEGVPLGGGGIAIPFPWMRVQIEIRVLPAGGSGGSATAGTVGGVDGNGNPIGTWLHLRYTYNNIQSNYSGSTSQGNASFDFIGANTQVEFDCNGSIILPYCGQIELISGLGNYAVNIAQPERLEVQRDLSGNYQWCPPGYKPTLRTLKRMVGGLGNSTFTVPNLHTALLSQNPSVTITNAQGSVLNLPNTLPGTSVLPGEVLTPSAPVLVETGVWL